MFALKKSFKKICDAYDDLPQTFNYKQFAHFADEKYHVVYYFTRIFLIKNKIAEISDKKKIKKIEPTIINFWNKIKENETFLVSFLTQLFDANLLAKILSIDKKFSVKDLENARLGVGRTYYEIKKMRSLQLLSFSTGKYLRKFDSYQDLFEMIMKFITHNPC